MGAKMKVLHLYFCSASDVLWIKGQFIAITSYLYKVGAQLYVLAT